VKKVTDGRDYSQDELDNHANQMNPNNDEYLGHDEDDDVKDEKGDDPDYDNDNHSNQLNPNNDECQGG
jgi:hypothetical protein